MGAAQAFMGIGCVGLVNLSVSFTLALWVALRARGVDFGFAQTRSLLAILWGKFRQDWRQFIYAR